MKNLILIGLLLSTLAGFTQSFKGNIIVGASVTQIDGDQFGGYDKGGFLVGGGVSVPLKEDVLTMNLQGMYVQKGSKSPKDHPIYFVQRLNYIDFPLFIEYNVWKELHLIGGLTPGILVSESLDNGGGFVPNTQNLSTISLETLFGAKYMIADNVGAGVRFSYSAISVKENTGWYNNLMSFYLQFNL